MNEGLGAATGFDTDLGVVSKKPPPLVDGGEVNRGGATEDRWGTGLLKPANGSVIGFC